jgi:hypothetical protein
MEDYDVNKFERDQVKLKSYISKNKTYVRQNLNLFSPVFDQNKK